MTSLAGGIARAFESRNFRIFWTGQLVNNLTVWINRAGIQWLAWELTHSFAWLGVIGAAAMVPTLFFGPIAGTAADRYGHRRQLVAAAMTGATVAFTMAAVTLSGLMSIELLFGLALLGGTTRAFTVPARNAMVHDLVEKANLAAAIGVNAATYQGTIFIGAALGGAIIVTVGSGVAFLSYGAGVVFAVIQVLRLELAPRKRMSRHRAAFLAELRDGFRYANAHGGIRIMLLISLLLALCVQPFQELLSGFAAEVFAGGAGIYTLLFSAGGFGAMLGGLWVAWRGRTAGLSRVLLISALAALCGLAVFAVSSLLWVTVLSAALTGGGLVVAAAAAMSLIQNAVDSAVRARVLSMASVIVVGAPALSAIAIGALASRLGVQGPLLGAALVGLVGWLAMVPAVRRHAAQLEAAPSEEALEHFPVKMTGFDRKVL